MHTVKGHLDQEAKNLRSTRINQEEGDEKEDIEPPQEPDNIKTSDILCTVIDSKELKSKSYSDQTGCFPINSAQGNHYIFLTYHYDTNTIHAVPIESTHTKCITDA